MPLSAAKRALIAVLIFLLLLIAGVAGFYYWETHRPVPAGPTFSPEIAGPPPDVMSVLPPDSPVIGYIDADALRKLPNFSLAGFVSLVSSGPQSERAYNDFVRGTGFDVSRDLDHAAVAYWLTGFGTPDNVLGQDRFVAVAEGRFDQPRIKAYIARLGGKQVTHGTQSIFQAPGNPPMSLEFVSPTRLVIAGGRNATDLVADAVSDGSRPRDPAMQLRLQKIGGAPLFAVAKTDHLPQSFYANFQNAPQLDQLARSVRALTLVGQPTGDTLNLGLTAECDSAKNALTISFLLEGGRMAASMAVSSPNAREQMTSAQIDLLNALVSQAKIVHQGNQVRINLNITPTMLSAPPAPKRAS